MSGRDNVVDRQTAIHTYLENRGRSESLFNLLDDDAYYERPIPLRHPVVFYECHISAFSVNCFLKKGLGHPGLDGELETLFARGIDPRDQQAAATSTIDSWPTRASVQTYAREADRTILDTLESGQVEGDENPVLYRGQGVFTALEHEVMHQETLLYMWHCFEPGRKARPDGLTLVVEGAVPRAQDGPGAGRPCHPWVRSSRRFRSAGTTSFPGRSSMWRRSRSTPTT